MSNPYLKGRDQSALRVWYRQLEDSRGDRARLRRAERPEDVLLTKAFSNFLQIMPTHWGEPKNILSSAAVAGLLAHVKVDKQIPSIGYQPKDSSEPRNLAPFAELLARPVKGDKAVMSEMRFQQLQKSHTTEEFYRRMIRAIRILDGSVNITSLANDIIHWHREFEGSINRQPANRLAVRWATEYYTARPKS